MRCRSRGRSVCVRDGHSTLEVPAVLQSSGTGDTEGGDLCPACEHAFVGVHGSEHGRFTKALAAGHLTTALIYAQDLPHLSLADALALCRLMARDGDSRFPRAASRWLARLSAEAGAGLLEVQMAAAALSKLWEEPDDELAMRTLRELLPHHP